MMGAVAFVGGLVGVPAAGQRARCRGGLLGYSTGVVEPVESIHASSIHSSGPSPVLVRQSPMMNSAAGNDEGAPQQPLCSISRRRGLIVPVLLPFLATSLGCLGALQQPADAAEEETMRLEKIRMEVVKAVSKAKAAGVLRLVFHDAGTFSLATEKGGMNGSIIYELERPESAGLKRPFRVLEKVKNALGPALEVSWADLISVAGAESVAICGGPSIRVKLGRLDSLYIRSLVDHPETSSHFLDGSLTPHCNSDDMISMRWNDQALKVTHVESLWLSLESADPEGQMPEEMLGVSELKMKFQQKGFSTQELVALSGAHTIGNKGFGAPDVFDNTYYQILRQKRWLTNGDSLGDGMTSMVGLASDRTLIDDAECMKWVNTYAEDEARFFYDFKNAYLKLVNTGAKWA